MNQGSGSDVAAPGFARLLVAHEQLDEVFWLHQELLLVREPEPALSVLRAYQSLLTVHMQHEEELLFPIFVRPPVAERWPLVLYRGQHRKLRTQLERCVALLESTRELGRLERRFVLELLERETAFKHLSEHHDAAERHGFFPALDAKASDEERATLALRCQLEFEVAFQGFQALFGEVRARLEG